MPVMRVNCPNCGQPLSAEITQLFDLGVDPAAKQNLLSGTANMVQCGVCGYQGPVATPLIYHDPEKELLLTYFPPELGLPRQEQERIIGSYMQQILNRLPQEKRKGYLLQPKQSLTQQGMLEQILEADGITKEMIDAQQKRLRLIQRLLTVSEDSLVAAVQDELDLLDEDFFTILARLAEASTAAGDAATAQRLVILQRNLLPLTEIGKQIQEQSQEVEEALKSLREAGNGLTREKLLDILTEAPNDTRIQALVSLTRPGLDYAFFQILSERIAQASEPQKSKLEELRGKLLELTREIDQEVEHRKEVARKNIETLLRVEDLESAILQNMPAIDEYFVNTLNEEIQQARNDGNLERSAKLNRMIEILQQASTPPELAWIEELIQLPNEQAIRAAMAEQPDKVNQEFIDLVMNLLAQSENDPEVQGQLQLVYRSAMRMSMERNVREG